jgi:hypothetical protein
MQAIVVTRTPAPATSATGRNDPLRSAETDRGYSRTTAAPYEAIFTLLLSIEASPSATLGRCLGQQLSAKGD